jgi:hypothetical protein
MKQILFLLTLLGLFTGCEKFLQKEETSIGEITSYDQLLLATGGVYGSLSSPLSNKSFYYANVKGDDITWGIAKYDSTFNYFQKTPVYIIFQNVTDNTLVWKSLYLTIASVNNIISQYQPVSTQSDQIKEIIGEMYLIRAYCHFRLTRNYGQIPLIDNIDIDYNKSKPTYDEIYKFIEGDLKKAMGLLPKNNDSARVRYVTPHRGTAKALLAEVYLSWAGYPANDILKYPLAAKEAGETIDSAIFFGFGLLDDFACVWDKPHYYNSESVLSLYIPNSPIARNSDFNYETDYASGGDGLYTGRYFENSNRFLTLDRIGELQLNNFPVEINFYNTYPACYRKNITFYTTLYYTLPDTNSHYIDHLDPKCRIGYRKFYYDPTLEDYTYYIGAKQQHEITDHLYLGTTRIYLFRYAQTVLTYAEAKARAGQPDAKAYECVNQIRRRANHLDLNAPSKFDLTGLSAEAFADSVVQERAWELCGEPEGRWYDLVRLEKVEELATLRNKDEGGPPFGVYNKSVYFSAIPADDIILNPNLGE